MVLIALEVVPSWIYLIAGCVCFLAYLNIRVRAPSLSHIPSVVPKSPFSFVSYYLGLYEFMREGSSSILERGYREHKNQVYKMATMSGWTVTVTDKQLIDELRKAPEDWLSMHERDEESIQASWILGEAVTKHPYHANVIKSNLTRRLGSIFPDIREEVAMAMEDYLGLSTSDVNQWKAVDAHHFVNKLVARASNRIFVGAPICRNSEYLDVAINFTNDALKSIEILKLFPNFMKPMVIRFLTSIPRCNERGMKHLGPVIQERLDSIKLFGQDYDDKPNDYLSWLIDAAPQEYRTVKDLTARILTTNFVAIFTTSMVFHHVLFDLAIRPELVDPLRQEIEEVTGKEGWTKVAMTKLIKMDSFIKEVQRFHTFTVNMGRKVMKPFTFSDGTTIPAGVFVHVAQGPIHADPSIYGPSANTFEPFRFINDPKSHAVTSSTDWLFFGHGQHACPGRFFAVNEMKIILCEILMNYEVQLENGSLERPKNWWMGPSIMANSTAKVMFRRRK